MIRIIISVSLATSKGFLRTGVDSLGLIKTARGSGLSQDTEAYPVPARNHYSRKNGA